MDRMHYQARYDHQVVSIPPVYLALRTPVERFLAGLLLVLCAPLLLMLMVLVWLTSPGGVIYRQTRVGKDGRPFEILKLRTMYDGAEKATGPVWCQPGDSRVTPLGQVLRKLHLDEMPQLVNVVRGEMSLIGPRPERPVFVEELRQSIPHYLERLRVRPGITGLAQIRLPPDVDESSVVRKVELDLEYIRSASPLRDLSILLTTALQLFGWWRVEPQLALACEGFVGPDSGHGLAVFGGSRATDDSRPLVGAGAGDRLLVTLIACSALCCTAPEALASLMLPPSDFESHFQALLLDSTQNKEIAVSTSPPQTHLVTKSGTERIIPKQAHPVLAGCLLGRCSGRPKTNSGGRPDSNISWSVSWLIRGNALCDFHDSVIAETLWESRFLRLPSPPGTELLRPPQRCGECHIG